MTVRVYWASLENEWLRIKKPEPLAKTFYEKGLYVNKDTLNGINACPAFNNELKNTFSLFSLYDYNFKISPEGISSTLYDKDFADRHLVIRSPENRFFSFRQDMVFFTAEDSLLTTSNMYPYLENNNVTTRCMIPQGRFDIGKWFRNTDFTFYLKPQFDEFIISYEEVYSYIQFHTDEKIELVQYKHDDEISSYLSDIVLSRDYFSNSRGLEDYYKTLKFKKLLLKKIKNNTF